MRVYPDGTFTLRTSDFGIPGQSCLFFIFCLVGLAALFYFGAPAAHPEYGLTASQRILEVASGIYVLAALKDFAFGKREEWTVSQSGLRYQVFGRSGATRTDWRWPKEEVVVLYQDETVGGEYGREDYNSLFVNAPQGQFLLSVTGSRGSFGTLSETDQEILLRYLAELWNGRIEETVTGSPPAEEGKRVLTIRLNQ